MLQASNNRKYVLMNEEQIAWQEYDAAAEHFAKKGIIPKEGDQLPNLMSRKAVELINADPEAFQDRVRLTAYARAMEKTAELVS